MENLQNRLQEMFTVHFRSGNILLINANCMEGIKYIKDKEINLACVDPPYGIGWDGEKPTMSAPKSAMRNGVWRDPHVKGYTKKGWDAVKPDEAYFDELFRVSKNQIVWGANHFRLPQSAGWIFWDKGIADGFSLSSGELAWTSFDRAVKMFKFLWAGFRKEEPCDRIHPTQKPVKLYEWLLKNYAKPGDKILDTHLGSGSSAIAAYNLGFEFTGFEIDKEYYEGACKRLEEHKKQGCLFSPCKL